MPSFRGLTGARALLLVLTAAIATSQDAAPKVVHKIEAAYTPEAQKNKISGTVVISLTVDEHGKPTNLKVVKGLGSGLDEEALKAVAQWRFQPATRNGDAVAIASEVKIDFDLKLPPVLISKMEPVYTEEARRKKLSGNVLISLTVDTDGTPKNMQVLSPLGLGLDQKAIEAVEKWRFQPGTKNGVPVPVSAQVEVSFRLCEPECNNAALAHSEQGREIFNTAIHELVGGGGAKPNPSAAFQTMQKAVAMEYPPAETRLGLFFIQGIGTSVDNGKAAELFDRAAFHGDVEGIFRLGTLYFAGIGVVRDQANAVKLFTRAASQDNEEAEYALGIAIESGAGTEKNLPQAVKWFRKSAEQGYAEAQRRLARIYWSGSAGKEDQVAALEWALLAEKNGLAAASTDVQQYRTAMAADRVAEAEKRAAKFKLRVAKPKI